jgi:hypothetical protein
VGGKAGLRIAYSNQKQFRMFKIFKFWFDKKSLLAPLVPKKGCRDKEKPSLIELRPVARSLQGG